MTDDQQTGNEPALGGHAPILDVRLGSEKQLLHAVEALGDENPAIRDRASQYLVKLGDARVTDYLLQEVTCYKEDHRRRAIRGLGNLKEARAVEPLVARLYERDNPRNHVYDNTAMRLVIIQALGRIGDENAIRNLREIAIGRTLRHEVQGFTLRRAAVAALKDAGDAGAFEHMQMLAKGGDHSAIGVLGFLRDPRAVPFLLERLESLQEDVDCQEQNLGDHFEYIRSRDQFVDLIERSVGPYRQFYPCHLIIYDMVQTIHALGEIGDRRAVEPLISRLRESPSTEVRRASATALGAIGDSRAVAPLMEALSPGRLSTHSTDGAIRAYVEALGNIGDPSALDLLIEVSGWNLRSEILRITLLALASMRRQRAVQPIVDRLNKLQMTEVRQTAVKALGMVYDLDERVPQVLIEVLNTDTKQEVRRDAATVLGQHREVRAVDALIKAFNEDRPKVQREAKLALKRIGTAEALAAIKKR